jgi:hypothetical protein
MSPSDWGPPTWIFLHTIVEKVKETSFPLISKQLIQKIIEICNNLPCPECTIHAKTFWSNVNISNIYSKQDLINLLFVFHNSVNKRKKMPQFKYEHLSRYKNLKLIHQYNIFTKKFNTNGNMNLINESFHRKLMMISLRRWLMTNISHFDVL